MKQVIWHDMKLKYFENRYLSRICKPDNLEFMKLSSLWIFAFFLLLFDWLCVKQKAFSMFSIMEISIVEKQVCFVKNIS